MIGIPKVTIFEKDMKGKYLRPFQPKTRPLIGQPAQSANQRLVFLAGKSLIICPPCSFQKTVTLVIEWSLSPIKA